MTDPSQLQQQRTNMSGIKDGKTYTDTGSIAYRNENVVDQQSSQRDDVPGVVDVSPASTSLVGSISAATPTTNESFQGFTNFMTNLLHSNAAPNLSSMALLAATATATAPTGNNDANRAAEQTRLCKTNSSIGNEHHQSYSAKGLEENKCTKKKYGLKDGDDKSCNSNDSASDASSLNSESSFESTKYQASNVNSTTSSKKRHGDSPSCERKRSLLSLQQRDGDDGEKKRRTKAISESKQIIKSQDVFGDTYDRSRRLSLCNSKLSHSTVGDLQQSEEKKPLDGARAAQKEAIKRESNRLNAARSRQRNKEKVEELRKKVDELKSFAASLQHANQILLSQVEILKQSHQGPLPPGLQLHGQGTVGIASDQASKKLFDATTTSFTSLSSGSVPLTQKHFLNDPSLLPLKQESERMNTSLPQQGISQLMQSAMQQQQAKADSMLLQSLFQVPKNQTLGSTHSFDPVQQLALANANNGSSVVPNAALNNFGAQLALLQQSQALSQQQQQQQQSSSALANSMNMNSSRPLVLQPQQQQVSSNVPVSGGADVANSGGQLNPLAMLMAVMGQNSKQQQQQQQQQQHVRDEQLQQFMALQQYLQLNPNVQNSNRSPVTSSKPQASTLASFQEIIDAMAKTNNSYQGMNPNVSLPSNISTGQVPACDAQSKRHSLPSAGLGIQGRQQNQTSRRSLDMAASSTNSNMQQLPIKKIDTTSTATDIAQQQQESKTFLHALQMSGNIEGNNTNQLHQQQPLAGSGSGISNKNTNFLGINPLTASTLSVDGMTPNNNSLEHNTSTSASLNALIQQQQQQEAAAVGATNSAQQLTTNPRMLEILLQAISASATGSGSNSSTNASSSIRTMLQQQQHLK